MIRNYKILAVFCTVFLCMRVLGMDMDYIKRKRLYIDILSERNGTALEALLKEGADVHVTDPLGQTPLHIAAGEGNEEIIKVLIKAQAHVNVQDKYGDTPLHKAVDTIIANPVAITALLKVSDIDVNIENNDGRTPLHAAVAAAHLEENRAPLNLLLNNRAEVNFQDKEGNTPLHIAAREKNQGVIEILLAAGANLFIKNKNDRTPADVAPAGPVHNYLTKKMAEKVVTQFSPSEDKNNI